MNEYTLPGSITALACAIAENIKNTSELLKLAAILGQLGSVLTTIAAQRNLLENEKPEAAKPMDDFS